MKKINLTKIMAIFALIGIILGIIGTGLLIIFDKPAQDSQTISQQDYEKLINEINSNSGLINSGAIDNIGTGITIGE